MEMNNGSSFQLETYSTKDLWLASALLAAGMKMRRLDWDHGRAFFIFDNRQSCETMTEAYWRRDLRVSAKDFADSLRTLKDRLFSKNGNGENENETSPQETPHRYA